MRFKIDSYYFTNYFDSRENEEIPDRLYDYKYTSLGPPELVYYYYIKDEIFEWFKELDITFSMGYHTQGVDVDGDIGMETREYEMNEDFYFCYWYIDIEDNEKAMLFKLTWC